jgi:hypothetical protein
MPQHGKKNVHQEEYSIATFEVIGTALEQLRIDL